MDYEKHLKEALSDVNTPYVITAWIEENFPKLKDSEDEKIRKELIFYLGDMPEDTELRNGVTNRDVLAWLEKQESVKEIVERCKNSWYNEGKIAGQSEGLTNDEKYQQGWHDALEKLAEPNWCHHKVDLSGYSEEYRKAYYDGWNNCNMQHSQCNVEKNDVIKCLINGMKFYYEYNKDATWGTDKWSMPVKHIIDVLEKQGEKTVIGNGSNSVSVSDGDNSVTNAEVVSHPTVIDSDGGKCTTASTTIEPKFNVGDFIVNDYCMGRVIELTNDAYLLDTEQGIPFSYEHNVHLWTIEDAKEGDIIYIKRYKNNSEWLLIFKKIKSQNNYIDIYDYYAFSITTGNVYYDFIGCWGLLLDGDIVRPATKEQCNLLLQKMKEEGYEWDAEEKDLKKIEQKPIDNPCMDCTNDKGCVNCVNGDMKETKEWIPKNGDVVRLKEDNGQSWTISLSAEPDTYEKWFLSLNTKDGIAGGWVSDYLLKENYTFVNNPLEEAKKACKEEATKLGKAIVEAIKHTEWSKDDNIHLRDAIYAAENIYTDKCGKEELVDWLKTLKDRVQPRPKQE